VTTWAFIAAALKALPLVLQLIGQFKSAADAKVNRGIGYDQAVKESLEEGAAMIATARQVEADASKDHATIKDDTAFDNEFQRKD
jgi:hypothetical protein